MIRRELGESANRDITEDVPDISTGRQGFWLAIIIMHNKLKENKNIWGNREFQQRHGKYKEEPGANFKDRKYMI